MTLHDNNAHVNDTSANDIPTHDTACMLKKELEECQNSVQEWKNKYIHLIADFENFKKRLEKDHANWELGTKKRLFLPLLAILDNFERALTQEEKAQKENGKEALLVGFSMIAKEFEKVFEGFGVKPMEVATTFNPEYHEAISQVPSDKYASGEIVQVLQKGYMLNDHVLRPAKVALAE